MRLATFNVRHGRVTQGSWRGTRRLVAACRSLDADVLAVQELDVRSVRSGFAHQPRRIARALGSTWTFAATRRILGAPYGIALLARGAINDIDVLDLPGGGQDEPRRAIVAQVTLAGPVPQSVLTVATTHLTLHRSDAVRQLAVVAQALAERSSGPRVLLGDLNLDPDSVRPVLARAGLSLVEIGPSYPAHAPIQRIDHVALARIDQLGPAEVLATGVSDHCAVVMSGAFEEER